MTPGGCIRTPGSMLRGVTQRDGASMPSFVQFSHPAFEILLNLCEFCAKAVRLSSRSRMPSSVATIRPWSTVWSALVNEPVLEPPDEASLAALAQANEDEHLIRDEDALGLVLIECDVAVRCRPSRPSRRSPLPHLSPRPPDPSPIQPSQLCPSPTHTLRA